MHRQASSGIKAIGLVAPGRLWAGAADGKLAEYSSQGGPFLRKPWPAHEKGPIRAVVAAQEAATAELPATTVVLTGAADGLLKSWSLDGSWLSDAPGHSAAVMDIVLVPAPPSPSAPLAPPGTPAIWSASDDGTVRTWLLSAGKLTPGPPAGGLPPAKGPAVKCLCVVMVGSAQVWAGFDNGTVRAWRAADRVLLAGNSSGGVMSAHGGKPVYALAQMGEHVWSGGADGSLQAWRVEDRTPLYTIPNQASDFADLSASF